VLGYENIFHYKWFIIFAPTSLMVILFSALHIKARKFKRRLSNPITCPHSHPGEYFLSGNMKTPLVPLRIQLIILLMINDSVVSLIYEIVVEDFSLLSNDLSYYSIALVLLFDGIVFFIMFCHLSFRWILGRWPNTLDLIPIDPKTGKRVKNPSAMRPE
jgi:hypothetical protein